jgi:hypothetical protein
MAWGSYFFGYEKIKTFMRSRGGEGGEVKRLGSHEHMFAAFAAGVGA